MRIKANAELPASPAFERIAPRAMRSALERSPVPSRRGPELTAAIEPKIVKKLYLARRPAGEIENHRRTRIIGHDNARIEWHTQRTGFAAKIESKMRLR
jgi:hypothetical protein